MIFDITDFRLSEKFSQKSLLGKSYAQFLQHLISGYLQFEIVLSDSDQAICGHCCVDLDLYSILSCAPKFLNLEVLLELLKDYKFKSIRANFRYRIPTNQLYQRTIFDFNGTAMILYNK